MELVPGASDLPSATMAANDELLLLVKRDKLAPGDGSGLPSDFMAAKLELLLLAKLAKLVCEPAPDLESGRPRDFIAASAELLLLVKLVKFASGLGLDEASNVNGNGAGKFRFADLIGAGGDFGAAGADMVTGRPSERALANVMDEGRPDPFAEGSAYSSMPEFQ
jgi:hypothetical protein